MLGRAAASRIVVVVFGCIAASCTNDKKLATLDGPLKVELRFEEAKWLGRGASVDRGELVVTVSGEERRRAAHCYQPRPELAGDGTTHRFAYRCSPGDSWTAVYVSAHDLFTACSKKLGASNAPEWASAPKEWVEAGPELMKPCAERPHDASMSRKLYRELGSVSEEQAVVFLTATRDIRDDATSAFDWTEAAKKLSPAARKKLGVSESD